MRKRQKKRIDYRGLDHVVSFKATTPELIKLNTEARNQGKTRTEIIKARLADIFQTQQVEVAQ